jgi:hypothetical protein
VKIFESQDERTQALVVAAGLATHAMLSNPNSNQLTVSALVGKAFEIANEFMNHLEAM